MTTWLSKVKSTLSGEADAVAQVRRELEAMLRHRSKLMLEISHPATAEREMLSTVVEQVREVDMVISQPSAGAVTRPLASGERVRLQFATERGLGVGEARVLGRVKLPSGGKRMFFGYRLSIPTHFETVNRRLHPRITLDEATAPHVHLATVAGDGSTSPALSATLVDISLGGLQVKMEGNVEGIKPGATLQLIAEFPQPIGAISHPVTVMRAEHDANVNVTRLGLQFAVPVPKLEQFLSELPARHAQRTG